MKDKQKKKTKFTIRGKAFFNVIGIALIIAGVSMAVSYNVYSKKIEEKYKEDAEDYTDAARLCLKGINLDPICDGVLEIYYEECEELGCIPEGNNMTDAQSAEYYAKFQDIKSTEEYKRVANILSEMIQVNGIQSVYICTFDLENEKAIYVVDGSDPETVGQLPTGFVENINAQSINTLLEGGTTFVPYVSEEGADSLSTATQSLFDDDGDLMCNIYADTNMGELQKDKLQYLTNFAILLAEITVVVALIFAFAVTKIIVNPIRRLSRAASEYSLIADPSKDSIFDKISINTGDELETLRDSFVKMEQEIKNYVNNITSITAEREKITAELNVAAGIQEGYLPREIPAFPNRDEFELYASMKPAKEVGGDFYDYYLIDDDHLVITAADVSGKGIPGALFMMESMTLLKNQARQGGSLLPSEILSAVNNQLCERNEVEMFVTVWMGILTISTGLMTCASAGHEYPVIKRAGGSFELFKDTHGFVLAGMENTKYKDYELQFNRNDMIFMYTDGVPEATNAENELFGTDRMVEALNSDPDAPAQDLLKNVQQAINAFVKSAPQFDDITMVSFKYYGPDDKTDNKPDNKSEA